MAKKDKAAVRRAVHTRIRRRVRGSQERPRLAIFRSLNHIYAQVIDDERAVTIASASTVEKDLRGASGGNVEAARRVGRAIAERAIAAGVEQVVFDRGGFRFHGRIKSLVDAAREAGLNKNERAEDAEGGEAEGGAEAAA
jgi:large subunit ribosomal protein L18